MLCQSCMACSVNQGKCPCNQSLKTWCGKGSWHLGCSLIGPLVTSLSAEVLANMESWESAITSFWFRSHTLKHCGVIPVQHEGRAWFERHGDQQLDNSTLLQCIEKVEHGMVSPDTGVETLVSSISLEEDKDTPPTPSSSSSSSSYPPPHLLCVVWRLVCTTSKVMW